MQKRAVLVFILITLLTLIQDVDAQEICNNNNICDSRETRASCPNDCKMKMSYLTHIYDYSGGDPNCMTPLLSDFKTDLDEYIRNTPGNQRTKYVVFNMNGWDIESTTTRPDGYKGTYRFKACPDGPIGCVVGTDWGGIYEDAIDYANSKGFTVVVMPPTWPPDIYDASGPPTASCPFWSCPVVGSDTCSCVTTPDSVLEEEFYNWMLYLLNDRGYKNKDIIWHIGAEYDQFDYKGRWSSALIDYRLSGDNPSDIDGGGILERDPNYITSITNLIKKTKDAVAFVGSNQLVTTASAGITGYLNPTYDPNTDDSIKQHLMFYGGTDCTPTNLIGCNTGIGDVGVVDSVDIIGMDLFLPDISTTNTLAPFIQYMSSAFGKPLGIWQANIYGNLAVDPYETQRTSMQLLMDKYAESVIDYVTVYEMRDQTWFDGNPDCNFIGCSYYCKGDFNIKCDFAPIGQPPIPPANCPIASGDSTPICVSYGCDDPEGIKYWDGKKKVSYDLYIDMFNKYGGIGAPITNYAMLLQYDYDTLASPICPAGYSQKGIFTPTGGSGYTAIDYQGTQTDNAQHQFCAIDDNAFLALRYDYQTGSTYFCPAGYTDKGIFYPQSNPTQPTWTTAWGYDLTNPGTYITSSWAIMQLCSKDNSAFLNVRWDDYNKVGNSCPIGYYSVGAFKVPTQPQGSTWYAGYGYDPVTNSYPANQFIESGWMQLCVQTSQPTSTRIIACNQDYNAENGVCIWTGADCSTNDYPSFASDTADIASCNPNECIYNSICYADATYHSIAGENLFCSNGKWWDFDNRKVACEGIDDCSNIYTITNKPANYKWIKSGEAVGEYDNLYNAECCGDDPSEYFVTGLDGTSACCDSPTDTVYRNGCLTSTRLNAEEDGYITDTLVKNTNGNLMPVGPRINDCWKFRGWIDFNTITLPDTSIIYNTKLTSTVNFADNPESRIIDIKHLVGKGTIQAVGNLHNDIIDGNTYHSSSNFPVGIKTIDLGKLARTDLKNQLASDFFSVGLSMPDESCAIGSTHAYIDIKTKDSGIIPYLDILYSPSILCTFYEEDTDCDACVITAEKDAYANAWVNGNSWSMWDGKIMQKEVSIALKNFIDSISTCS